MQQNRKVDSCRALMEFARRDSAGPYPIFIKKCKEYNIKYVANKCLQKRFKHICIAYLVLIYKKSHYRIVETMKMEEKIRK